MSKMLLTAAGIMLALARASSRREVEAFNLQIDTGKFRHRGKGRGAITHNHLGKTSPCRTETGKRESARRRRQLSAYQLSFKQLARLPGWTP
ncbi:MAG: hypothetical protein IPM64_17725 [Phycisphaerales bacterium]|nr:hypothetical protein [Phycisphaerales bacterium]